MKLIFLRSRSLNNNPDKIAEFLLKEGYDIKLLLWDRQNNYYNKRFDNSIVKTFNLKAPYDETKVVFYHPFWLIYATIFLMFKDNSDIIHAADLDTLIPACFVKVIKRKILFYTIYDFYADNLPSYFPNFFRNMIKSLERFLIRFVDHLFLVDESRYEQVKGSKIKKLSYIYNTPEDCYNKNLKPNNNKKILFYAGVLHEARGLNHVIKALTRIDDVKLVFAGSGPLKSKIEEISRINNKFNYLGVISYEEVIKNTAKSDIIFAFYDPKIGNNKYASPNKLFEAMMLAKPIIVNDGSSMSKIVEKYNCGIIVPYGDVNAMIKAIIELKNNPQLCDKLGKNGRKAYENEYSWDIMKNRLINDYKVDIN
jgi:glycosyltransferase involved in cell wall biosynthesis